MKFYSSIVALLLCALIVGASGASAQKIGDKGKGRGEGKGEGNSERAIEQTVAATATVNVTLSTRAGNISVRGWDRQEVHALSKEPDTKLELRKTCNPANAADPASQVEVLVSNKSEGDPDYNESDTDTDVSLDVPRGATLFLKTQDGDIEIADVAEAHLETSGGRMELRRVSKVTEATSVGGDVELDNSSGRARLTSFGGSIEVTDFRALDANDFLKMRTTSGDILLKQVTQTRVDATTISGELKLEGKLARGGSYTFMTTTGDLTLALPADSSFKLNARISENGEIVTEFPIKYSGSTSPGSLMQAGRLSGTYGTGDATLNLTSFNGTIRLMKR
jgi:DUF4097 and DUF4098 domain-containing protein YvlB